MMVQATFLFPYIHYIIEIIVFHIPMTQKCYTSGTNPPFYTVGIGVDGLTHIAIGP